jgi:hypothetical protein
MQTLLKPELMDTRQMGAAITWEGARDMLREYVFAAGADYKYTRIPAKYFVNGMPSCIIGHLFIDLFGDEIDTWMRLTCMNDDDSREHAYENLDTTVEDLFDMGMLVAGDEYVKRFLQLVQDLQDHGNDWFYSVERAVSETVVYKRQYEFWLTQPVEEILS